MFFSRPGNFKNGEGQVPEKKKKKRKKERKKDIVRVFILMMILAGINIRNLLRVIL
jgi:hypothetical protein